MILSLFKPKTPRNSVRSVYGSIVAAARHPKLYAEGHVPDTVDGRYDMIVLHTVLVLERLRGEGKPAQGFAQALTDEVFADMDRSLREMGVGDLSVGKKVRRMAEVFYGRAGAYAPAIRSGDEEALEQAICRNVFAGAGDGAESRMIAAFALRVHRTLHNLPAGSILSGQVTFPDP